MGSISSRVAGAMTIGLVIGASAVLSWPSATPALAAVGADESERCTALVGSELGGGRIDAAKYVAPGTKLAPLNLTTNASICQVRASISAALTSKVEVEIWLPARWNHKLLGFGGGGFNGGLASAVVTFPVPVNQGYVAIATDSGHDVTDTPTWALGKPERIADYGYRANHLGAGIAKALAARYYGAPVKRAYFHGCSNGGRDALMLAQRFPKDYDGIIAGAPANSFVSLMTDFGHYRELMMKLPPNSLSAKMKLLHEAVVNKCDALDGAKDGLINNPQACRFDPGVLMCKSGQDANSCLAPAELEAVRAIYQGTRTRNGRIVQPGLAPGSEYQWPTWVTDAKAQGAAFVPGFFGYFVYGDPNWSMASFNVDRDLAVGKKNVGGMIDATNSDLRPFIKRGGKLLMYHGWDDAAISPENSIAYYSAVKRTLGADARQTRLFMMPGVAHCFDGAGPSSADFLGEIDRWVEGGAAPERIIAAKPENILLALAGAPTKTLMSRPLCAWPKVARYSGKGDVNQAANFECRLGG